MAYPSLNQAWRKSIMTVGDTGDTNAFTFAIMVKMNKKPDNPSAL